MSGAALLAWRPRPVPNCPVIGPDDNVIVRGCRYISPNRHPIPVAYEYAASGPLTMRVKHS